MEKENGERKMEKEKMKKEKMKKQKMSTVQIISCQRQCVEKFQVSIREDDPHLYFQLESFVYPF